MKLGDGEYINSMGKVSKDLNKNCSVRTCVTLEVESVIRACLFAFPYIWASVLLIDDPCLIMLYLIIFSTPSW